MQGKKHPKTSNQAAPYLIFSLFLRKYMLYEFGRVEGIEETSSAFHRIFLMV